MFKPPRPKGVAAVSMRLLNSRSPAVLATTQPVGELLAMARRRWSGLVSGLFLMLESGLAGTALADDVNPTNGAAKPLEPARESRAPYELTCWQAGLPVIQERDIADLPLGIAGTEIRKTDGSTLVLVDAGTAPALCLLRRPTH